MAAHPCMSMVTGDAGRRGHMETGPAEGKQRGSRGAEHPESREQYTIRYAP